MESQQNVDHNVLDQAQSTDNDDITGDSSEDSPVVVSPQAHNFRNIRRTMSGALEVYGAVGVSVVARSSPHMQRRQSPHAPSQESSMYATAVWSVALCALFRSYCLLRFYVMNRAKANTLGMTGYLNIPRSCTVNYSTF